MAPIRVFLQRCQNKAKQNKFAPELAECANRSSKHGEGLSELSEFQQTMWTLHPWRSFCQGADDPGRSDQKPFLSSWTLQTKQVRQAHSGPLLKPVGLKGYVYFCLGATPLCVQDKEWVESAWEEAASLLLPPPSQPFLPWWKRTSTALAKRWGTADGLHLRGQPGTQVHHRRGCFKLPVRSLSSRAGPLKLHCDQITPSVCETGRCPDLAPERLIWLHSNLIF